MESVPLDAQDGKSQLPQEQDNDKMLDVELALILKSLNEKARAEGQPVLS